MLNRKINLGLLTLLSLTPVFSVATEWTPTHGGFDVAKGQYSYNSMYVFNPNRDNGFGEKSEYSTPESIKNYLIEQNRYPSDALVLGLGIQVGTDASPTGRAGELFINSKMSDQTIQGIAADPATGRADRLDEKAHLGFAQIIVADPNSGITKSYEASEESKGTVLWNFYTDETSKLGGLLNLHNTAGDYTNKMFQYTQDNTNQKALDVVVAQNRVFQDQNTLVLENFKKTNRPGLIFGDWLEAIRDNGWNAAAVFVEGSILAPNTFRLAALLDVPLLSTFKPLAFIFESDSSGTSKDWLMTGVLFDRDNNEVKGQLSDINYAIDSLGNGFHLHGMQADEQMAGHVLFAMLGDANLKVTLYPLDIVNNRTVFNNDLILEKVAATDSTPMKLKLTNKGENYVRGINVVIDYPLLSCGRNETKTLDKNDPIKPNESVEIPLDRDCTPIRAWIKPRQKLLEGGEGTANNTVYF